MRAHAGESVNFFLRERWECGNDAMLVLLESLRFFGRRRVRNRGESKERGEGKGQGQENG